MKGVANILTEEGNVQDPEVLQAALLHDTVEDTNTTLDEIEGIFGKNVRSVTLLSCIIGYTLSCSCSFSCHGK